MDFVTPFIGPFVESLTARVKKHFRFFVSSTEYVEDMKNKMDQLEDTSKDVQDDLEKAVLHAEVVPAHAQPWLKEVERLKIRRNSIEAIGCFNVIKRYKAGKKSCKIMEEIEDLENPGPSTSAIISMGTQNNFESRDSIFNDALQALRSNKESETMVALCGMAGVGKTTMMEQLEKAVADLRMFDWVVKVVIGENSDPYSLQQDVAQLIGERLNETAISARADSLRKIFEVKSQQGRKKNLVIMDDLWKKVDLTVVGLSPLPNGFKLSFTSRFEDVCNKMDVTTDLIFKIRVLSDPDAKALFFTRVGPSPSDGDEDELRRIGEAIVKKCCGLPIAIVTIAENLKGKTKEAWNEALSNLQHGDLQDLYSIVHKIFEMSYNNLEKEDDKAIFILSGLFPDDFNIPVENLMVYGWGLKLFTKFPEDMHRRMKTLEVGSYENMGTPMFPITLEHSTSLRTLSLRSCSLTGDISFIGSLSNLETLSLADCNIRRLPSTIGKLKKLRLLNLTGCVDLDIDHGVFQNLDSLEELYLRSSKGSPVRFTHANCDEFEKLSQLRYLHVSKCAELQYLFTVDVANGLTKLERLTISECPVLKTLIGENDGVGVVTLKKLNFMSLEDLPEMVSLCDNVVELPELVELKLAGLPNFTSIYPDSHNTDSMQPLFNTEGAVPKLENLDICLMENLKQIWPCQISTSEKNEVSMLRQITVGECDSLINLFPINPLPLLNHLEEVVVKKCGSIEVLFNIDFESVCEMGKHSSSRLRRIEVERLGKLKELWRMKSVNESDILVNNFKEVQTIHIEWCDNFTDIFTPTTTKFDLRALTDYVSKDNSDDLEEREKGNKMIESNQ
ncbi:hypothetical protein M8C21_000065, partial [Ambrosia artemisiifolia]